MPSPEDAQVEAATTRHQKELARKLSVAFDTDEGDLVVVWTPNSDEFNGRRGLKEQWPTRPNLHEEVSSMNPKPPKSFAVARWSTAAWGALHILGGALLLATTLGDGARETLLDLGFATDPNLIPSEPGSVVEAVLGFYALAIFWFGLAALILARRGSEQSLRDGLFVMAAADVGLVVFLLGPGQMRLVEGIWGPLLLVIAASAFMLSKRPQHRLAPETQT